MQAPTHGMHACARFASHARPPLPASGRHDRVGALDHVSLEPGHPESAEAALHCLQVCREHGRKLQCSVQLCGSNAGILKLSSGASITMQGGKFDCPAPGPLHHLLAGA